MARSDLVTLEEAKDHLRVSGNRLNADIQAKLDASVAIVYDYLQRRDTVWNAAMEDWTADTVPLSIKQAILIQLGELDRRRGDDANQDTPQADRDYLSPTVMALLQRHRDPALA